MIGESGRRYKDGAPKRKLVNEKALKEGQLYPNLNVPRSWKSDSDSRTINKNFEQVSMVQIIPPRVNFSQRVSGGTGHSHPHREGVR